MDATEIYTALLEPAGKADPYQLYAALHELGEATAPMAGLVVVHGYDAVNSVLCDPDFVVADAAFFDRQIPGWREHPSLGTDSILNLNPPRHARIRSLMSRAFTHRRVAGLEPVIAELTDGLLDQLAERG